MSDEQQDLNLEDVGASDEAGGAKKPKIFSGLMLTILKYAAIGISIIIVSVTATWVAFTLLEKGKSSQNMASVSEAYTAKQAPLAYYDSIDAIRGQTADETPAIFLLRISIGYDMNAKEVSAEIGQRTREIQDLVLKMISMKTASELNPQNYDQIQTDILNRINAIMANGKVQKIVFREFSVVK
jgi:flagellar protein FliL